MSNLFFFFIIIFGWQIGALEAPDKRVSSASNSVKDRSFYVLIKICFNNLTNNNEIDCVVCGGTIISFEEILTAGHCVAREKLSTLSAKIFFGDFRRRWRGKGFRTVLAETIEVGPEQIKFLDNIPIIDSSKTHKRIYPDLAIVYLGKAKIPMMNGKQLSILRPCPPDSKFWVSKFGGRVSVVGLGRTNANDENSKPKALQEAELEISDKRCIFEQWMGFYDDQETLCVIGIKCLNVFGKQLKSQYDTDVNVCNGDSGGPVFRTFEDGRGECLVGAVSGGVPSKVVKLLRPFQDHEVADSFVTSVQKLGEWRKNGYFVSVKKWNDDQNCITNGTYPPSFRRYIPFVYSISQLVNQNNSRQ